MSATSHPSSQSGAANVVAQGPVKIVVERRARPGAEEALRRWAERFVVEATRSPGHEGGSVLSAAGSGSHLILLRFGSSEALEGWQHSAAHASLMREADEVSSPGDASQIRTGLETWFTLPDMPAPVKPPPQWKMAIVTWVALLPLVIALAYIFAPFRLPFLVEVSLSTAIPVALLTWLVMPAFTRLLYGWLYPQAHR